MSIVTFDRDQADWGSLRIYHDGTLIPFKMDKVVIHHIGNGRAPTTEAGVIRTLRAIQRGHLNRDWVDSAYAFGFDNQGLVWRIRGFNRSGATSGDLDNDGIPENHEALAFLWIGGNASAPSAAAYASMENAIREVQASNPLIYVTVHSDHKATDCPGDLWRAWANAVSSHEGDDTMQYFLQIFNKWTAADLDVMKAAGYWKGDTSHYYGPTVTNEEKVNLVIHVLANGNKDIPTR